MVVWEDWVGSGMYGFDDLCSFGWYVVLGVVFFFLVWVFYVVYELLVVFEIFDLDLCDFFLVVC